jgi:hypothetical protein
MITLQNQLDYYLSLADYTVIPGLLLARAGQNDVLLPNIPGNARNPEIPRVKP